LYDEINFHAGTSILDAIGKTVTLFEESNLEAEMEKHLLIFSDFEENSSSFYNVDMIGELIVDYRQKKNWEFYAFGLKLSQESLFKKMNFNSKNLIFLDS
jgi:RNA-binding protein YhbY